MLIETTIQDAPKQLENLHKPPQTHIRIIIDDIQTTNDSFQELLNHIPSKGNRPVVEVLREIRDEE